MKTIHKFRILRDRAEMPAGAELLHVGEQHIGHGHYALFVWARVDTSQPAVQRILHVIGTGWHDAEAEIARPFVGTVQCQSGEVYHVFDGGEA
jgi:hypothetical protein